MEHTAQIKDKRKTDPNALERKAEARELAALYLSCFTTEAGQRVLADLRAKFPLSRARFSRKQKCEIEAALVDGECNVMREISNALRIAIGNKEDDES